MNSQGSVAQIISQVPLFLGLKENPEALNYLSNLMIEKTFKQGHLLLEEGQLGDEFYILVRGKVSVRKKTPDGDLYKVAILGDESHPALGEGGLIEAEPRSATIQVEVDSSFLVLDRDAFQKFTSEHPEWAVHVLKKIAGSLIGRLRQTSQDLMLLHKALMNEVRG